MTVRCELCPKLCLIEPGQSGECRIRVNIDGKLRAVTYGFPSAAHVDPVEKKPLNHFLPGSSIYSLATVGCNLHCKNCQNWEISQRNPEDASALRLPVPEVPRLAKHYGCRSIAYTYTDPVVYYEYALDCSIKARELGLKNVLVTAGYINPGPLRELCRYVDAANIDLKAFSDKFYRTICSATLKPVLDTLVTARSMGVMVEVTNLLIPTLNDDDKGIQDLCNWIKRNLGAETPIHFSRFFPRYRMRHLPATPPETLERARRIAVAAGLNHVYAGNVFMPDASNTRCPSCRALLVERVRYRIVTNKIEHGCCPKCKTEIHGIWE